MTVHRLPVFDRAGDRLYVGRRLVEVDRVRGLAILLMLVDHLAYVAGPVEVRMTVGRLAMPLFMVLAGSLVRRVTYRHGLAAGLGLLLTVVAPWAGTPNVLLQYLVGVGALVALRWASLVFTDSPRLGVWLLLVLVGVAVANGWSDDGWSYEQAGILSLMAVGSLVGLGWAVSLGSRLPTWLAVVGARPLTWYAANVAAIQGVIWWLSRA